MKGPRHVFIVNPAAGKRNSEGYIRKSAGEYFSEFGGEYTIRVTEAPMHASEIAREEAQAGGPVRLYACGGDGTLNEVINGAFGYDNAELACVPTGTGNDYIKNFMKREEIKGFSQIIEGASRKVDAIKYDGRYSANVCSMGLDAEVGFNVTKFSSFPFVSGDLAYYLSALYCLIQNNKCSFKITMDGGRDFEGEYLMAVVANGKYYGGDFLAAPKARIDDGILDFVLVKHVSRSRCLTLMNSYRSGEHEKLEGLVSHYTGRSLSIRSEKDFAFCVDGECFYYDSLDFEVLPKALNFVVPSLQEYK
jgi:diacylglycerol kinase (ATP)